MSKAEIAEKVKELINAPSCCAELKAVGKAWLEAVVMVLVMPFFLCATMSRKRCGSSDVGVK